ncbi:MAG: hypothetical protein DMF38_10430 [Verrucomicrobia bacterium]|nr:MAG: hypothetical protein DME78_09800 [Verrucomicrobiota bacterium]PYL33762.1 MAG: hypothetical protein DMF38_10430 [Verrucomicrobiota bacterium]
MQRGSAYTFRDVSIRMDFARSAFGVRYVLASLLETAGHRAYQKRRPANVTQILVEQSSIKNMEEE